jgi:hypothetical protein
MAAVWVITSEMSDLKRAVHPGDRVQMRKPHPCGSAEFIVFRIGADIGLRCVGCDRRILLPRAVFAKRVKAVLSPEPDSERDDGG